MKLIVAVGGLIAMNVLTQNADPQKTVQQLVASFNNREHKVVDRRGVKVDKYLEIRSEPVVKTDVRDYSGRYLISDLGYSLDIKVASDGTVAGNGSERSKADANTERRFVLKNAKIDGALLRADKVYEDGSSERFEGVFINMTRIDNAGAKGESSFGIGAVAQQPVEFNGVSRNRLFYRRQG